MKNKGKVFIIDNNLKVIKELIEKLKDDYKTNASLSAIDAIESIYSWVPDIILLDSDSDEINAPSILLQLTNDPALSTIPVIVTTNRVITDAEFTKKLELGAIDCIYKNISSRLLLLKLKLLHHAKKQYQMVNYFIEKKQSKIDNLSYQPLLYAFGSLSEFRAENVGFWHVKNCTEYAKILLDYLIEINEYPELITSNLPEAIIYAMPFHDIGKMLLPESILMKPGKLDASEFEQMKLHTNLGVELVDKVKNEITDELVFNTIRDIVHYHHENWDGTGYPKGLKGEDIPISARIVALIDQYDTIVSKRVYKEPSFHFEAVNLITDESGKSLDPDLVYAFLQIHDRFLNVIKNSDLQ